MRKLTILILKANPSDKEGMSWIRMALSMLSAKRRHLLKSEVFVKECTLEAVNYNILRDVDYVIITGMYITKAQILLTSFFFVGDINSMNAFLSETQKRNISSRIIECYKKNDTGRGPREGKKSYVDENGIAMLYYPFPGDDELLINHLLNYDTSESLVFHDLCTLN